MNQRFDRKVFSTKIFWGDLGYLLVNISGIIKAMRNPVLGKNFMTRTMLVVTAVNGCSYCSWYHAKQAVASGMSEKEIRDMFNLQFSTSAEDHELLALLFAQHYAETDRQPENEMVIKLNEYYGETTAYHITLFIRMIFFGNLFGNTFDAFISRISGVKPQSSSVVFETIFFIFTWWFMLPTRWLMERQENDK